jgi:hypothetical protein
MRANAGAATSVPTGVTYTLLPIGSVTMSSRGNQCFRVNGDNTVTILQAGWYTFTAWVSRTTVALTAQARVRGIVWVHGSDVTPTPPTSSLAIGQVPADSSADAQFSIASIAYLGAFWRIGVACFHSDSAARTFQAGSFAAAFIGRD